MTKQGVYLGLLNLLLFLSLGMFILSVYVSFGVSAPNNEIFIASIFLTSLTISISIVISKKNSGNRKKTLLFFVIFTFLILLQLGILKFLKVFFMPHDTFPYGGITTG